MSDQDTIRAYIDMKGVTYEAALAALDSLESRQRDDKTYIDLLDSRLGERVAECEALEARLRLTEEALRETERARDEWKRRAKVNQHYVTDEYREWAEEASAHSDTKEAIRSFLDCWEQLDVLGPDEVGLAAKIAALREVLGAQDADSGGTVPVPAVEGDEA